MKNRKSIKSLGKYLVMFVMAYIMLACTAISANAAESIPHSSDAVSVTVMADTAGDGWSNINTWITNVSGKLKVVGYSIAGIAVVALAIVFITGGGQALQKGKGMAIGILVGIATLSFGMALIGTLRQ